MKNVILPSLVVLGIVGLVIFFSSSSKPASTPQTPSTSPTQISPYDENAKVMYFFSDYCGWCQKQKEVLEELAKDGYRVKPMDVGRHQEYWQEYSISGTPAFIAPDNQRLIGYKDKETLKEFLEKYK